MKHFPKLIISILLLLLIPQMAFSVVTKDEILALKDKSLATIYGISSAMISIPMVELDGVEYIDKEDDGLLPQRIIFNSSDVSTYYGSLSSNAARKGSREYFLALISSYSPIRRKAEEKLLELNLDRGDFIIDGYVDISGGEDITLSKALFSKDLSYIDVEAGCNLLLSGSSLIDRYSVSFLLSINGGASIDNSNRLVICITECYVNEIPVFIEPISVLFGVS